MKKKETMVKGRVMECRTCEFFEDNISERPPKLFRIPENAGQCRFSVPHQDCVGLWTWVRPYDWCGKHIARGELFRNRIKDGVRVGRFLREQDAREV